MDKKEVASILGSIALRWRDFSPSAEERKAWAQELASESLPESLAAVSYLVKSGECPYPSGPTIGAFFKALREVKTDPSETGLSQWALFRKNGLTEMSPRGIKAFERCGGWPVWGPMDQRDVPFFKKDFLRAYDELEHSELTETLRLDYLPEPARRALGNH